VRSVALLALVLAASGCGGAKRQTVSGCLNEHGFLVSSSSVKIVGTSPEGTGFTLDVYRSAAAARHAASTAGRRETTVLGTAVVDASGNPDASPRLSRSALARIRDCLRKSAA
jgi:hypothetical protein